MILTLQANHAGNHVKSVQLSPAVAMCNNVFSGSFGNSQVSWFAGKSGDNVKSVQLQLRLLQCIAISFLIDFAIHRSVGSQAGNNV